MQIRRQVQVLIIIAVSVAALAVRYPLLRHITGDMKDFYLPWYEYIVAHGGYRALGDSFANYSPPYTYLLTGMTYLRDVLPDRIVAIKLISIAFDFLAAFVMYRLVRLKHRSGPLPLVAYAAVLFAPTIILNGSYWGQVDIIYSTFLLVAVFFAVIERPLLTISSLAVAFAFKAQAAFLAPFILILLARKKMRWSHTLIVPATYLILMLPAALLGRPLGQLVTVYLEQSTTYRSLSMNAANLYNFIPNAYYVPATALGLAVAAAAAVGVALLARHSKARLSPELLLKAATLSVAMMPLLLPKMHDRYFFPADLISIGLAFYCPTLILAPIAFQCTSAIAYAPYLLGREIVPLRYAGAANALVVVVLLSAYILALYPLRVRASARSEPSDSGEAPAGG